MRPSVVRAAAVLALAVFAASPSALAQKAKPATKPAAAANGPAPTLKQVAAVEGITEYALPNGLRVLFVPDATKPTFTINLTVLVGSRHEGYGETGMAHLLEHMLFKGSPRHKSPVKEMNDRGAQWNGSTWVDRTNYFEVVPTSDANLEWAVDFEADRFVHSFISGEDLKTEFTVVRNEFESGENSPFRMLLQRTLAAAYEWHNYGKSTIGNKADIEGVPVDRLQTFYRKFYQPDNAILVLAGRFDAPKAMALIADKFGRIPRPARSLATGNVLFTTYTEEPVQDGERIVNLRRTGDVKLVMFAYHIPSGTHPDFAALDVLGTILGTDVTGRIYKAVVDPKIGTSSGAFAWQFKEPGVLVAFGETRKEQMIDSVRLALEDVLENFTKRPVTAEELDRAKTELLKNIELTLNKSEDVGLGLSEWAAMGDWRFQFIHRDRIRRVTVADVQRVAQAYLLSSNRTLGMFHPTTSPVRAEIPKTPDFGALVASYTSTETRSVGEAFDVNPAKIDGRIRKSTLANGMKVNMLPKQTRGGAVSFAMELRYGTEAALTGKGSIPDLMVSMLERGTTARTRAQMKDTLDKLKARVGVFSAAAGVARLSVETTKENLVAAIRLLAEQATRPSFPADEFDKLKLEQQAQIEQQRTEPTALGSNAAQRLISPYPKGHPLYVETFDESLESIKAVTLDQVKAFHAAYVGAQAGDVAVAGDFDADAVAKVLADEFGGWRAQQPYARVKHVLGKVDSTVRKIETPDKKNALFIAAQPIDLRSRDPEWVAFRIASFIFGESPLSARIGERLRQKEGLSYGAGAFSNTDFEDRSGSYIIQAIYNPANNDKLVAAAREELEKALKDGFTADEVEKAKTAWLQSRFQVRAEDRSLIGMMLLRSEHGLTFDGWDGDIERRTAKLTVADVNAAFRKYISAQKVAWVVAGDFAGAKKEDARPKP